MTRADRLLEASVSDEHGLRTATYPAGAATTAIGALDASRNAGIHLVQVEVPTGNDGALVEAGFRPRPTDISWIAEPRDSQAQFLRCQSSAQRQRSHKALLMFDELRTDIVAPVPLDVFEEWHDIYRANVSRMPFGVDIAGEMRETLVEAQRVELLAVRDADARMIAGVVLRDDADRDLLSAAFSAVAPGYGGRELPRALYLRLVDLARDRGRRHASLGSEPNSYGHLVRAGLAAFKTRLGFVPVSRQLMGGRSSRTVFGRMVSIAGLTAPVMSYAYPRGTDPTDLAHLHEPLHLVAYTPGGAGLGDDAPAQSTEVVAV